MPLICRAYLAKNQKAKKKNKKKPQKWQGTFQLWGLFKQLATQDYDHGKLLYYTFGNLEAKNIVRTSL